MSNHQRKKDAPGDKVTLEVTFSNDGKLKGEETALFFLRDPVASVSHPVLELKGVKKLTLEPGQSQTIQLILTTEDMTFPGLDFAPRLEAGVIELFVGPSARQETLLKTQIRVVD
ncbi:MAG: hypothetical protein E6G89_16575 [Alphaproteobacteria bacterium]|nr:MAG: hypothetical protein E6G89_16575 [Alphaproteobacteria bacterium]